MLRLSATGLLLVSSIAFAPRAAAQSPSATTDPSITTRTAPPALVDLTVLSTLGESMALPTFVDLSAAPAVVEFSALPGLAGLTALPGVIDLPAAPAVLDPPAAPAIVKVTGPIAAVELFASPVATASRRDPGILAGRSLPLGLDMFRSALTGRQPFNRLAWTYVGLQSLDFLSTRQAMGKGASESNPVMKVIVGQPLVFAAVKSVTAWALMRFTGTIRVRHPRAATYVLGALDGVYAMVVIHNYRTAARF
jgi:hypothetical protein